METMKILSIDAWGGDQPGLWDWNAWYTVGSISKTEFETLTTNRKILKWFRDNGYLNAYSQGKCGVDDDQYNITVTDRKNNRPLYAIEYGPTYN